MREDGFKLWNSKLYIIWVDRKYCKYTFHISYFYMFLWVYYYLVICFIFKVLLITFGEPNIKEKDKDIIIYFKYFIKILINKNFNKFTFYIFSLIYSFHYFNLHIQNYFLLVSYSFLNYQLDNFMNIHQFFKFLVYLI